MFSHVRWSMPMKRGVATTFAALLVFTPAIALAHPGHDGTTGLLHGLMHPVTGIDHIFAMVAVGLLAAQYGGRTLWLLPMSFLVVMGIAGSIGMAGVELPIAEIGIALSVVVLGLAIAFQIKPPTVVALTVVAVFALFHGYAHGAETPDGTGGLSFAAGFLVATSFLLGAGVGLGLLLQRQTLGRRLMQAGGGVMALVGITVLASLF